MTLFTAFRQFQTQYTKDPQTTQDIKRYIESNASIKNKNVESGIVEVEDHIRSIRNRKIKHIMVYLDFVCWLKNNVNKSIQSNIPKDYVTSTRRIELVKYLQQPHSRSDITEQFVINDRTLNSDFKALENGIDVLGCTFKVRFKKYDRDGRITIDESLYHSSCNPLFLPLNMTELFLLTNVIPNFLTRYDELSDSYQSLLKKLYPQLTDYCLDLMKIDKHTISNENRPYEFEYDLLVRSNFNKLVYFLKREEEATFIVDENGTPTEIKGVITNISDDSFKIKTKTGSVLIGLDKYLGVKDFDKTYK